MKVSDILKTKKRAGEILWVKTDDSIVTAIKQMVEQDTGSVVVYDSEKCFKGMLTFREILQSLHQDGYVQGSNNKCGDLVDTKNPYCATPDDSVDQIRNLMTNYHIRYLPIVQNDKITDVVSFYDVARSIVKAANFENRLLKEYIRNWPEQESPENE